MRSHRLIAALVAMTAVVASCSSGHGSAGKLKATATTVTTPATTASTTTSTTVSPEAAVLAGYRGFKADYVAVGLVPDGNDPRLAAHATGRELAQIRAYFTEYRARGLVQRGDYDLAPRVVFVTGATALVRDCYVSHLQDIDAKTGAVKASDPPERVLAEYSMELVDGVWKVSFAAKKGTGCTSA